MKKIFFTVILAASITASFGQLSITPFSSFGFWKHGFNGGLGLSYNFNERIGAGFQFNSQACKLNTMEETVVRLQNASVNFYIHESPSSEVKWFFEPTIGVLIGLGSPLGNNDQDLRLLKHPYFAGLFLAGGPGYKISEKMRLTAYFKLEATVAMITDRPIFYENVTTLSNLSGGLKLDLKLF